MRLNKKGEKMWVLYLYRYEKEPKRIPLRGYDDYSEALEAAERLRVDYVRNPNLFSGWDLVWEEEKEDKK